jgi:hypothetical protein
VPAQAEWVQPVLGQGCGNAVIEIGDGAAGGRGSVAIASSEACFWPLQSHSPLTHWPFAHWPLAHWPLAHWPLAHWPLAHWPLAHWPLGHGFVTAVAVAATAWAFSLQQSPSQHSLQGTAGGAAGGMALIRSTATRHGKIAATIAKASDGFMFDLLHETGRKVGES